MEYNYTDRIKKLSKYFDNTYLQNFDREKIIIKSVIKDQNASQKPFVTQTWVCEIVFYYVLLDVEDYVNKRRIITKINRELIDSFDNNYLDKIDVNSSYLRIRTPFSYKQDLVNIFNQVTLSNTVLKMMQNVIKANLNITFDYSIGLNVFKSLISFYGSNKNKYLLIPLLEKDDVKAYTIAENIYNKMTGKIGISQLAFINLIDTLNKDNDKKYSNWIKKASDQILFEEYYYCDIVKTKFNEYINIYFKKETL